MRIPGGRRASGPLEKRLDDAKEQERIREGEEAVRKAMERKERIALAKLNRDRRMAEEQAAAAVTTATFSSVLSGSSDSDTHSMQDSSPRVPEAAKIRHSSRVMKKKGRLKVENGSAPTPFFFFIVCPCASFYFYCR
ncbi:hypothetical protein BC940DRAFT_169526 [Gongronella butleri]|nr:hypothetical protein BC940DRAFT_169526 [Gongronella butleri]